MSGRSANCYTATMPASDSSGSRWLLLIHQIPPKPAYFRAKVGRRLARIGAVALKNSVYVLPRRDDTHEDFQWTVREIVADGGEATLCAAQLVEGLADGEVEAIFQRARQADYVAIADEARAALRAIPRRQSDAARAAADSARDRLARRLAEVRAIDFFDAPGREPAEAAISAIAKRVETSASSASPIAPRRTDYRGRRWVTRKNVHVDRIASAWLIQRFIDPDAELAFVADRDEAQPADVTYDMFQATFTHIGDRCTFEVLLDAFAITDPGLRVIAEIVHDIDVKDAKFQRTEAPGVAAFIAGLALGERDDLKRIAIGGRMFEALHELHKRRRERKPT